MDNQLNELSKGEKAKINPNRYKLRSKKKEGNVGVPNQTTRAEKHVEDVVDDSEGNKVQTPSQVAITPIPEVKDILKHTSPFSFEHEVQKIRIPVPLSDLVKHEDFRRSLSKLLMLEPTIHPIVSVNLQDENLVVMLGPLVEDIDDSSHPFYTSLNIHDKVLHNFLMDSGSIPQYYA
jgi:hypothetical protein